MTLTTITAPVNVAQGIRTRLQHIKALESEIGLIVSVTAETQGLSGNVKLLSITGDVLSLEVEDVE